MNKRESASVSETGRRLQACVISSGNEDKRLSRALTLAAAMLCENPGTEPCRTCRPCRKVFAGIHPDVITVKKETDGKGKERRELYVAQIRALVLDAYIRPHEAERKVYIVKDAGDMTVSAQNAFLKLLEEPPYYAAFLLCVENEASLLPTVRSRCTLLHAGAEELPLSGEASERAERYLEAVASGKPANLLRLCAALEKLDGGDAAEFVEAGRRRVCEMLCRRADNLGMTNARLLSLEKLLARSAEYLRMNVGVRHICGLLAVQPFLEEK
jgi:DNA polymerase-3 subunit delta'